MELALVKVDIAAESMDEKLWTYKVPPELEGKLVPYQWVRVPFGYTNIRPKDGSAKMKRVPRYVAACYMGPTDVEPPNVKPIAEVITPAVPAELLDVARWMADRYMCTQAHALRLMIPAPARSNEKHKSRGRVQELTEKGVRLVGTVDGALVAAQAAEKRAPARAQLLRLLVETHPEPWLLTDLEKKNASARGAAAATAKLGLIEQFTVTKRRDPFAGMHIATTAPMQLTSHQADVLDVIEACRDSHGPHKPILLHGVTGSGKTEVYMQAIAGVIEQGKQAIVLVPEIALTPQLVSRFRSRFGDRLAVLHSALSDGERYDEWLRIRNGDVDVVIGVRSAIFAPCDRLGMVILDEEHENTYKQAEAPCYHARDVAEYRASLTGALVLLGSATPAIETYYRSEIGEVLRVEMPVRVRRQAMPAVQIVDMKEELKLGNLSIFSRSLADALEKTVKNRGQAVLFLNRRGHSTYVFCRTCGDRIKCKNCDVTMTYHMPGAHQAAPKWLECHHCGYKVPTPKTCPKCGSKHVRFMGAGTERIESEVNKLFPHIRCIRMDMDTTRNKGAHQRIIGAFEKGEYDVLIGTQMVAKGLDIPNVTLVGAVLADTTLGTPDMRAAERTFQLLVQVAGRAGRADRKGEVIIQTYNPDNYAIQCAAEHDFLGFYQQEIAYRNLLGNPPFVDLIRFVISGVAEEQVANAAHELAANVKATNPACDVIGPCPAPLAKIQGKYRYHVLLKGKNMDELVQAARYARTAVGDRSDVDITVDVDPRQFM